MPKPTKGPRLGGSSSHQKAILANLATSLFEHGRIKTTEPKARALRPYAEKLITHAKKGSLHNRREVLKKIRDKDVVHALFAEIGPSPAEADHIASFALPIDDLDLTVRSYNCLKREGVHTVGELVARTESDLLDIRNFGQKSIDEVKIKLHQLGLSLKDSPATFDPSEVAGYDVATGTWSTEAAYDDQDYAETEQL